MCIFFSYQIRVRPLHVFACGREPPVAGLGVVAVLPGRVDHALVVAAAHGPALVDDHGPAGGELEQVGVGVGVKGRGPIRLQSVTL